jgi:UDP-N-acetylmuramate--alanine ligase
VSELHVPQRVHVIGVAGAGMSGLAKLLVQAGHSVSGSDLKPARVLTTLEGLGIETWTGHRPEAAAEWDLVVVSSAVPDSDPEASAARRAGVPVWGRPRLLAEMTAAAPALGVTGTHGKTTTTGLMVTALRSLGRDPSFMVGGELAELNTNAHLGEPGLFVLEADEAFGTFLELSLVGLVVTSIEVDHLDHYETPERLEEAFAAVAAAVDGPVVGCLDDPGVQRLMAAVPTIVPYGTNPDAVWRIEAASHPPAAVAFDLVRGRERTALRVPRPGIHVARNAAGALALLGEMGLDVAGAAAGLGGFGGVRRRFELRWRRSGITVVDDYAHHPTEVAATIGAARLGEPRRVLAVFQPHRYSRTAELAEAFGPALAAADRVIVSGVYSAGEPPIPGVSGRLVARAVRAAGGDAAYVGRRADLAAAIAAEARPGDLVLLMGAGDITSVPDELAPLLGERS